MCVVTASNCLWGHLGPLKAERDLACRAMQVCDHMGVASTSSLMGLHATALSSCQDT